MKVGQAHRVPLSDPALAVLDKVRPLVVGGDGQRDANAPIFAGGRRALPLSNMVMLMLLRRMGRGELTTDGFRSTFFRARGLRCRTREEADDARLATPRQAAPGRS